MAKLSLPYVLAALAALAVAGCESSHHRGPASDEPAAPAIAMTGQQAFFDGQIRAEATLGRGRSARFADDDSHSGGGSGGGGGHHGGGGGRHGGMRGGGGGGGAEGLSDPSTPHMHGSPLPPVKLRFRLVSLAQTPLDVEIVDVNSDLGDFAVRPDHFTLDAGRTIEVDPMFSQLGVTSDEIPVTVALKIDGKTEKHDLILKLLPAPAPETPAATDAPPTVAAPTDAEKK